MNDPTMLVTNIVLVAILIVLTVTQNTLRDIRRELQRARYEQGQRDRNER